ncbi:MAG: hypothetical protein IKC69_05625 [Clostridia bacterium]|nr:hypothetical protein [Clostridia bacterium]
MTLSKRMKEKTLPLLKAIGITIILDFICYAILAQFIGAGKLDGYYSSFTANLLASVCATLLWVLLFHWFYTSKTNRIWLLNVDREAPFCRKKEAKRFFREECIPLLVLYGVFTVLFEIIVGIVVLRNTRMHWLLAYLYAFLYPFRIADDRWNLFLSPLLSVAVLVLLILCLALLTRKRLYKRLLKS